MITFITISRGLKKPVLMWQERDDGPPRILGRYASIEDATEPGDCKLWHFPGTVSTIAGGPVNESLQPVVDADGAPLWSGARISFRVPTFYVNSATGKGSYTKTDQYGGSYFVSDQEMDVYDRGHIIVDRRREQYSPVWTWPESNHELAGCRVLSKKLGDPFEHGQTEMFFRLDDDPRRICKPKRFPVLPTSPGPNP